MQVRLSAQVLTCLVLCLLAATQFDSFASGANLRNILAHSVANRWTAAMSGLGVTALVQSSTATALSSAA